MEIVDEILTPGCPNCAVKHLSAAITYAALDTCEPHDWPIWAVNEARARINAVEFLEGYESHFELAVGFLELAEEEACSAGSPAAAEVVRERRVKLMASKDAGNVGEFVKSVPPGCGLMMLAHIEEALREMPKDDEFRLITLTGVCSANTREDLVAVLRKAVAHVRREYFEFNEPGKKGGEDTMTCNIKKPVAKKADPKAKQVACKGGKKCK